MDSGFLSLLSCLVPASILGAESYVAEALFKWSAVISYNINTFTLHCSSEVFVLPAAVAVRRCSPGPAKREILAKTKRELLKNAP
jgi:hypothetical protein